MLMHFNYCYYSLYCCTANTLQAEFCFKSIGELFTRSSPYRWTYVFSLRSSILHFAHIFDRSSISKILQHISFLLVNLGFTMPINLYSNKKTAIKFHVMNIKYCLYEFLFYNASYIGSFFVLQNVSWWSQICWINYYEFYDHIVTNMANLLWMLKIKIIDPISAWI